MRFSGGQRDRVVLNGDNDNMASVAMTAHRHDGGVYTRTSVYIMIPHLKQSLKFRLDYNIIIIIISNKFNTVRY